MWETICPNCGRYRSQGNQVCICGYRFQVKDDKEIKSESKRYFLNISPSSYLIFLIIVVPVIYGCVFNGGVVDWNFDEATGNWGYNQLGYFVINCFIGIYLGIWFIVVVVKGLRNSLSYLKTIGMGILLGVITLWVTVAIATN